MRRGGVLRDLGTLIVKDNVIGRSGLRLHHNRKIIHDETRRRRVVLDGLKLNAPRRIPHMHARFVERLGRGFIGFSLLRSFGMGGEPTSFTSRRDEGSGTAGSTKSSANAACGNLTDMRVCHNGVNATKSLRRFRSRAEVGRVLDQQDVWKPCGKSA